MKRVVAGAYRAANNVVGFVKYLFAITFQRPYFGTWLKSAQCYAPRIPVMINLIRKNVAGKNPFNVLEIGAWAGTSTIIWAKALQDAHIDGKVYVIDHWKAADSSPLSMRLSKKFDSIFKLFLHNIRTAGVSDRVVILRGTSDELLAMLPAKFFDFIYVDGDHAYSQAKKDIAASLRLLKNGGTICGDDLETQDFDEPFARAHAEQDFIKDTATGVWFHPGVAISVKELIGPVPSEEGFWNAVPTKNL